MTTRVELERWVRSWPAFPVKGSYDKSVFKNLKECTCSWEDAERAYENYSKLYGEQESLEQIAQRGGFSRVEMDFYAPGWAHKPRSLLAQRPPKPKDIVSI